MSYLIQLRARIKATEITKKTTNAMRLIAMSTHMRLRQTKASLDIYTSHIEETLHEIMPTLPQKAPSDSFGGKNLIVIVGSQKGLCGNFNSNLSLYFQKHLIPNGSGDDLFVVGKQMRDRLYYQNIPITFHQDQFSASIIAEVTHRLAHFLYKDDYNSLIIYHTKPKTFFLQAHEITRLRKNDFTLPSTISIQNSADFEQSLAETIDFIGFMHLKAKINELLIDSLIAEAASRFLSMDAATRNANDIIALMQLDYNKVRQAAITRELTDLAGVYLLET